MCFILPGKYHNGQLADEDECEDLIMFIQILSFLTTKDYLDFGNGPSGIIENQTRRGGRGGQGGGEKEGRVKGKGKW